MPLPPVYVVVAGIVTSAVAVYAFKQLVYDPHIAPRITALRESQQRRLEPLVRTRRRPPTPPAPDDLSDDDDDNGLSVEMRNLVASETAEWRSVSDDGTLRRRMNRTSNVLDESNVFLPFDPISPISTTPSTTAPSSPPHETINIRTPPAIQTPLPRHPVRAETLHAAIEDQGHLPTPQTTPSPPGTRLLYSPAGSDSTQSSFTPAVIGPRSGNSSPFSDGGRSATFDIVSPPPRSPIVSPPAVVNEQILSPATSPFSHVPHPLSPSFNVRSPSPEIVSPPNIMSPLHIPSESDFAILSPELRSGMFSDTDSDPFDGSDIGTDDMSAWESVGDRTPSRTPSPPSW
ncbi:hypothetical protein BDY19DRAFT_993566 [Irpex rosettiformis]|uniref:Uncharacterized protein n=1 Tax=Irpex rosettiformis TaxID=378272 RepID=A0ACB8U545_9APHY|nr:hypothetical protein BDY19DRAFT_993566 [Irpex rosettiformis]